jgi:hypothetical protein
MSACNENTILLAKSTKCRKKLGISRFALVPVSPTSPSFASEAGASSLMGAQTGFRRLAVFIVFVSTIRAHAACVDLAQLAHSTVNIMRYFDEAERDARPDLIGIMGTGWFLSPTTTQPRTSPKR